MSNTATQLSAKRIATFQKYSAPLVLLSDTAQQTAIPLLDALVRESLHRGLSVVAVCIESIPSADILALPNVSIVDCRPALDQIIGGTAAGHRTDFVTLRQTIQQAISAIASKEYASSAASQHSSASGAFKDAIKNDVLVAFDSVETLLRTSTIETMSLLRTIRKDVLKRSSSRVLVRFPRDILQQRADIGGGFQRSNNPPLYSTLASIADAVIDVYPLDALPSWMPGWYSKEDAAPFISLKHNDSTHCLLRVEHRKQSGKIGLEVASFEINQDRLPMFRAVDASSPVTIALQAPLSQQHPSHMPKHDQKDSRKGSSGLDASKLANAPQVQRQLDPTAGLPFNLHLTEKQRRDKATVELPYLEAQLADTSISSDNQHTGGEIHYQLDETDDWDDEDDLDDDLEI
ncbi:hypothetical protein GGI23_006168 [Coemansia sp. RSA 2559]|nr:hypothetical protein GGI23_006168 [Coemansia sp. RSA 2559]